MGQMAIIVHAYITPLFPAAGFADPMMCNNSGPQPSFSFFFLTLGHDNSTLLNIIYYTTLLNITQISSIFSTLLNNTPQCDKWSSKNSLLLHDFELPLVTQPTQTWQTS
jgi:hypothetical protein